MNVSKKTAATRAVSAIAAAVMTMVIVASQVGLAWHYAPDTEARVAHPETPSEIHSQQHAVLAADAIEGDLL